VGEYVSVQVTGGLATIQLNRPPMNVLNFQVQDELREAADQVTADPEVRAVVLYGGPKVFAAGADVKEMAGKSSQEMADVGKRLHAGYHAVSKIPKPVVAAVAGFALGGGLELALCADFRVCGQSSKLGVPRSNLGSFPDWAGPSGCPG
jgi:enoyl-CoA hydratase/carnithine racemase